MNGKRSAQMCGRFSCLFVENCNKLEYYKNEVYLEIWDEGEMMKKEIKNESVPKYDKKKWKKIMDTTQSNYANMIKRLSKKQKVSNFVLIYYSIFLIITTLTSNYFPEYFNSTLGEYFGVILSVIVLAYSLINNSANYAVRIEKTKDALNSLKTIKRKLEDEKLSDCVEQYNSITDNVERREDVDFFRTVKHLCKEYHICWLTKKSKNTKKNQAEPLSDDDKEQERVVNNYISEINVWAEEAKIIFENAWIAILFLVPFIIFALCVIFSEKVQFIL